MGVDSDPPGIVQKGDVIDGKFVVERILGSGGMGLVVEVRHVQLNQRAALKFLRPHVAANAVVAARFLREAQAAARIRSEHVVRVTDVGRLAGGAPFMVMECLDGQDLRAVLRERERLPVKEAVDYVLQGCEAIAEAHELGIVHRDLKPANLFLTHRADGSALVKVLDFGIAKALPERDGDHPPSSLTVTNTAIGSTHYMPPEQVRNAKDVDERADIWSLGVILHELVAGSPPFDADTASAVCAAIVADPPARLRDVVPAVPEELAAVVLRCLEKDPDRRYSTVGELALALQPFASGDGRISAERASRVATRPRTAPARATSPHDEVHEAETAPEVGKAQAGRRPRRASFSVPLVGGLVLAAAVAGGAILLRARAHGTPATAPVAAATTLADLPAYGTTNAEAARAFREGLSERRAGRGRTGRELLRKAIALDPAFPAPYVELLVVTGTSRAGPGDRADYATAEGLRDKMTPRDRAVLEAIEPMVMRVPSDWGEAEARLRRVAADHPGDAEVHWLLGWVTAPRSMADAAVSARRSIELDPQYAAPWGNLVEYERYTLQRQEARADLDRCMQVMPRAMNCLYLDATVAEEEGRCGDLESIARHMIALDGSYQPARWALAKALASTGSPAGAREALSALPAADTHTLGPVNVPSEPLIDLLVGDFDGADALAQQAAHAAETGDSREARGAPALLRAEVAVETGRIDDAAAIASDYLARNEAWEPDPDSDDFAYVSDPTPTMLGVLRAAGRIDARELGERRRRWIDRWPGKRPDLVRYMWAYGFGSVALVDDVADDARAALDAMQDFAPPAETLPAGLPIAGVGVTLAIAGRTREAVPWLERAARTCRAATAPFEQTRALYWLGRSREALGDGAGACQAYATVVSRWGDAKASVTASAARARRALLACK
jgi:serine/threonine-protein kinase